MVGVAGPGAEAQMLDVLTAAVGLTGRWLAC